MFELSSGNHYFGDFGVKAITLVKIDGTDPNSNSTFIFLPETHVSNLVGIR